MKIEKYNWKRFIPFLEVHFTVPLLTVGVALNHENYNMWSKTWVRYEVQFYKWHWSFNLYSPVKDFTPPSYLTKDSGVELEDCECVIFSNQRIKVYCEKHWTVNIP